MPRRKRPEPRNNDCGCVTHDGPHWLHMDHYDHVKNLRHMLGMLIDRERMLEICIEAKAERFTNSDPRAKEFFCLQMQTSAMMRWVCESEHRRLQKKGRMMTLTGMEHAPYSLLGGNCQAEIDDLKMEIHAKSTNTDMMHDYHFSMDVEETAVP